MPELLRRVLPKDAGQRRRVDEVSAEAVAIVEDVRARGEAAVREHGERLGDLSPGDPLLIERVELERCVEQLDSAHVSTLLRVGARVTDFAMAQRQALTDIEMEVPGGRAGHRWLPLGTVGAYAPGGRYPLPSSVLMTVIPAVVAGVGSSWVASPRAGPLVQAAAAIAGASGLVAVGGAQGVAALAFGTVSAPCDMVVGPGNRWVTAAKRHLVGEIGIDGLAGPSEIMVVADQSAGAFLVAADLLAQAEHDTEAVPMLVTTDPSLPGRVDRELEAQLTDLPTAAVARPSLANGFAVVVDSLVEAARVCDRVAPEHLALHLEDAEVTASMFTRYGSVFIGSMTGEVFADYGAGPNHVLPTDGGARYRSGLSVMTFLRASTWLEMEDIEGILEDTVTLARLEGLEGHARAALARRH